MQRQFFKSLFLFVLFLFSKSLHSAAVVEYKYQSFNQSVQVSISLQFSADEENIIGIEDDEEKIDHLAFQIQSNTVFNSGISFKNRCQLIVLDQAGKKQNADTGFLIHLYCIYRL